MILDFAPRPGNRGAVPKLRPSHWYFCPSTRHPFFAASLCASIPFLSSMPRLSFLATTARSIWASLPWGLAHRRFRISSTEILNLRVGLLRPIHGSGNTETESTDGFTIDFAPRSQRATRGKPRYFETSHGANWHIIWIIVETDLDLP